MWKNYCIILTQLMEFEPVNCSFELIYKYASLLHYCWSFNYNLQISWFLTF